MKKTLTESIRQDLTLLNEYFASPGDSLYDAVANLNVLTDSQPGQRPSDHYEDFADSREWMEIENTFYPASIKIHQSLRAAKTKVNEKLAQKIDSYVYDGSDAYEDVEVALDELVPIYEQQLAFLKELLERVS